jgi:hypothetical protein
MILNDRYDVDAEIAAAVKRIALFAARSIGQKFSHQKRLRGEYIVDERNFLAVSVARISGITDLMRGHHPVSTGGEK